MIQILTTKTKAENLRQLAILENRLKKCKRKDKVENRRKAIDKVRKAIEGRDNNECKSL